MGRQLPLALRLRPGHSFATLVPGDNVELVALLQDLAAGQSGQVFLWGEPGSGRSHMLEAAVGRALEEGFSACLLPGRELAGLPVDVLEGLEEQRLLAVDDLEALAGHKDWEEALFHLYNRCRATGTAMLFAAASAPHALGIGLPDLSSRLAAGSVYRVRPLEEDSLVELVRSRARQQGLDVGADVARFIVHRSERSPGALVSYIERLDTEALVHKRRLTVPFVKDVLGW